MQFKGSRLSSKQTSQLLTTLCWGKARPVAELTGLNRKAVTSFYHRLRVIIKDALPQENMAIDGELGVDESCS